ncbi:hypothetical protein STENM327S_06775 [Streptomyces tendae]
MGGGQREGRGAVEQRVGALVGEVADGGGLEAGVQEPGAQSVQPERGEPHHAVAAEVGLVDGGGGLLVGVGHERLVDGLVLDEADRFQQPELVVQAHHRVRHLLQDLVARLAHVAGHDHRGGQRGQRHRGVAGSVLADGQQVEVAEHAVEELGLGVGVPVEGRQVGLAALGHRVDQVVEVGHARVGEHGLQGGEPHPEHVLGGAAGEQGEVLARGHGARLLVGDLDEPGVHGDPPGLARVGGGVVPAQPELLGRRRQLLLDEAAPGVDAGVGTGPAGQSRGPGEHRRGQRVAGQLRVGAQPCGRQGGAV